MPRFFISKSEMHPPDNECPNGSFLITGSDAQHIAFSLRMRVGDTLVICDMQKVEYQTKILSVKPEGKNGRNVSVLCAIDSSTPSQTEPSFETVLFQAMPKAAKMDVIVQKSVEIGVTRIVPFQSERCVAQIGEGSLANKLNRWQTIAQEAAMQSGRGIVPTVEAPISYTEAVRRAAQTDLSLLCYEGDGTVPLGEILRNAEKPRTVSVLIGSEGGFSVGETEIAAQSGLILAGLGKRILRCETAAPFFLSCLTYQYDL